MAATWVKDAILISGSLQGARKRLEKLQMGDEARQVLNEVLDADAALMRQKTDENRFEVKHPEIYAEIVRLESEGNSTANVLAVLKEKFGKKAPSRATVYRVMTQVRRGPEIDF